jgi:hypothetical protein
MQDLGGAADAPLAGDFEEGLQVAELDAMFQPISLRLYYRLNISFYRTKPSMIERPREEGSACSSPQ